MLKCKNDEMHKTWSRFAIKNAYPLFRPKNRVPWYPLELKKCRTRRLGFHKLSLLPIYLTFWPFSGGGRFLTLFLLIFHDLHFVTFLTFSLFCFCQFWCFLILSIFITFWVLSFLIIFMFFIDFDLFLSFEKGILKIRPSFDPFS